MKKYNPSEIEPKWQQIWADTKLYAAIDNDSRPKYYMLTEFPYPSGDGLHAGHAREYTLGDVISRHKRMQGYNVLYPMGYDAFGLPTENYAIKHKIRPQDATAQNVANFRKQFESLGYSFDWDRQVLTTDPNYYKWTQWLFLKFVEAGLAYQAEMPINWCPKEKTGLANEEVVNGVHERCGTPVEKKLLRQWMLKITAYADRLIDGLKGIDFPPRIADQQINWIGRSEGAEIDFAIGDSANYVLLHGYGGSSQGDFMPWLKRELGDSSQIQAPDLPNTDDPDVLDQAKSVLENCEFNDQTVLFGHSLGAAVALKVVEQLKTPIRKLVLAAGFAQVGFSDHERPFEKKFDWKFDFDAIKSKVGEVVILRDTTDSAVSPERADHLAKMLGAKVTDVAAEASHFLGATEPSVLQALTSNEPVPKAFLEFIPKWIEPIISGQKHVTFRMVDQHLKEGDLFRLVEHESKRVFGIARIKSVDHQKLGDIPLDDPRHEHYESAEERREKWSRYHSGPVTDDTEFWIYDYELVAPAVTVFTTRPDTLAGATFLVLAPEHPAVAKITTDAQREKVEKYVRQAQTETDLQRQEVERPKTGVFTGAYAVNPITGEQMPVWIADYVLAGYGTGAIMAVPAHDERDYAFAKVHNLPIKPVIEPVTGTPHGDDHHKEAIVAVVRNPKTNETLMLDWGPRRTNWGGMLFVGGGLDKGEDHVECAIREIAEETGYTDVKFVSQTEVPVNTYYYSNVKDRHDKARMFGLLFELQSDQRGDGNLDEGEKDKFTVKWVPDNEVLSKVDDQGHELIYRMLTREEAFPGTGVLINSGQFDGLAGTEAKHAIVKHLYDEGVGRSATQYRLRDWIFSRQHYWGEPIPIIHCPKDGAVPVPEDQLPVTLPDVEHYEPTDTGESPLAAITDWVNTTCPTCGGPAKRETDTMPNWAGSSWYYLRFMDPHNDQAFADPAKLKYWGSVDLYLGGMEHTTLHLLYSRFWHEFFYDQKLVPTPEPYAARRGQGIVLASDGRKMSKSIGNVINPTDIIARYGADSFRLYMMFMAPYDETTPWSDERLGGVSRFLYRVWTLAGDLMSAHGHTPEGQGPENTILATAVDRMTHKTLKKVHDDLHEMRFNTYVSALMEYVNFLSEAKIKADLLQNPEAAALAWRTINTLVLMLAPAAPHIAEELWHELGHEDSVHVAPWPAYDPELLKDDIVTIVVQVNGKVRANLALPADATDDDVKVAAHADPNVTKHLAGQTVVKTIVVPRKLVNFVVK